MAIGNTVTLVGNVTRDPEVRFTKSGTPVAQFGLAYNNRKFNKTTNDYDEEVSFFDVTVWQSLAENVGESLHKGDRVVVSGRLEQQTWETDEGAKRSKVEIVADEVGPSLRWASAKIMKNERENRDSAPRSAPSSEGSSSNAPADDYVDEPF